MGYLKDTLKGLSWMTAFRVLYRIIGIIRIAIIAHLLSPYGIGVFGVVTIVLAFLEILTETGINVFLIQQKEDLDGYFDTAWVVSIIRGILIAILIFVTAGPVSSFLVRLNQKSYSFS